jgi:hypothetical protein
MNLTTLSYMALDGNKYIDSLLKQCEMLYCVHFLKESFILLNYLKIATFDRKKLYWGIMKRHLNIIEYINLIMLSYMTLERNKMNFLTHWRPFKRGRVIRRNCSGFFFFETI